MLEIDAAIVCESQYTHGHPRTGSSNDPLRNFRNPRHFHELSPFTGEEPAVVLFQGLTDSKKSAGVNQMNHLWVVAYLDPGTGSMLLQAIVGGSAGLLVFVRHLWRTFRVGQTTIDTTVAEQ